MERCRLAAYADLRSHLLSQRFLHVRKILSGTLQGADRFSGRLSKLPDLWICKLRIPRRWKNPAHIGPDYVLGHQPGAANRVEIVAADLEEDCRSRARTPHCC